MGIAPNRSVDWKVLQLDEAGMRGVYGGKVVRVSGIDHVKARKLKLMSHIIRKKETSIVLCPLDV